MAEIKNPSRILEAALTARIEARGLPLNAWREQLTREREIALAEAFRQHEEAQMLEFNRMIEEMELVA